MLSRIKGDRILQWSRGVRSTGAWEVRHSSVGIFRHSLTNHLRLAPAWGDRVIDLESFGSIGVVICHRARSSRECDTNEAIGNAWINETQIEGSFVSALNNRSYRDVLVSRFLIETFDIDCLRISVVSHRLIVGEGEGLS